MEETLTKCFLSAQRESTLCNPVGKYLNSINQSPTNQTVTWRTVEAFNSFLATCGSQDTPDMAPMDILLDNFYYLANNNNDGNVWNNFGFEFGVISVKILSAIERTDMFEDLFYKLLTIMEMICEHNPDIWKAIARQILNVFINKEFSFSYLKKVLTVYNCILKKVQGSSLNSFSLQNLNLLKTLSMLIQRLGDFETQTDIAELVFLHISDKNLLNDFFTNAKEVKELFKSLQFDDFEGDCRTYLNALNKAEIERKVFSISCNILYLGGFFVEPPIGCQAIWLDANKGSERLSFKCSDFKEFSISHKVIYIEFSDLVGVRLEKEMKGNYCLTINTKNLKEIHKEVKNDDILCIALEKDNTQEEILEFVDFIEKVIRKERKKIKKTECRMSQTCDHIFIDRSTIEEEFKLMKKKENLIANNELQNNAISSSVGTKLKFETDENFLTIFKNNSQNMSDEYIKNSMEFSQQRKTEPKISTVSPVKQNIVQESQELSPNSFIESLNKNLGLDSPEPRHSFEDSVPTIEFIQKSQGSNKKCHKLYKSPDKIFHFIEEEEPRRHTFIFEDKNGNKPEYGIPINKEEKNEQKKVDSVTRVLTDKKNLESKFTDSQSAEYFHQSSSVINRKKKPTMPKLKKKKRCVSRKKKKVWENEKEKKENKKRQKNKIEVTKTYFLRKYSSQSNSPPNKDSNGQLSYHNIISVTPSPEHSIQDQCLTNFPKKKLSHDKSSTFLLQESIANKSPKINQPKESIKRKSRKSNKKKSSVAPKLKESNQDNSPTALQTSLLDPNGYAYQRWLKPTTSERSNFWLEKLSSTEKEKKKEVCSEVFEFTYDPETEVKKKKSRSAKAVRKPRKKIKIMEAIKQFTLKQVKEFLKSKELKKQSKRIEEVPTKKENMKIPGNEKKIRNNKPKVIEQNGNSSDYSIQNFSQDKPADVPELNTFQKKSFQVDGSSKDSVELQTSLKKSPKTDFSKRVLPQSFISVRKSPETDVSVGKLFQPLGKSPQETVSPKKSPYLCISPEKSLYLDTSLTNSLQPISSPKYTPEPENYFSADYENISNCRISSVTTDEEFEIDSVISKQIEIKENDKFKNKKNTSNQVELKMSSEDEKGLPKNSKIKPNKDIKEIKKLKNSTAKELGSEIEFDISSEDESDYLENLEIKQNKKINDIIENEKLKNNKVRDSQIRIVMSSKDNSNSFETLKSKKRERSDEENSWTKALIKKKSKTFKPPKRALSSPLKRSIEKLEEQLRQQTDEIIKTMNKVTIHLLNHFQRKEKNRLTSYLKTAEEVADRLEHAEDSESRMKRFDMLMAYFEAGCSVYETCDKIDAQLSKVRNALEKLTENKTDTTSKIIQFNDRLKVLFETEINRSIKNELEERKNRLKRFLGSRINKSIF